MIIIKRPKVTSLKVVYHMPDYTHLLNEFIWQFEDFAPKFPKAHKFIDFWKSEIEGPINRVELYVASSSGWRAVDFMVKM